MPLHPQDSMAAALGKHIQLDESTMTSSLLGRLPFSQLRSAAKATVLHGIAPPSSSAHSLLQPLDMISTLAASKLIQCDVCVSLAEKLWLATIEELHVRLQVTSVDFEAFLDGGSRMNQSCSETTVTSLLINRSIKQVGSGMQGTEGGGATAAEPPFALCTRAVTEQVTDQEKIAATHACNVRPIAITMFNQAGHLPCHLEPDADETSHAIKMCDAGGATQAHQQGVLLIRSCCHLVRVLHAISGSNRLRVETAFTGCHVPPRCSFCLLFTGVWMSRT
jgi:hypothetical protein